MAEKPILVEMEWQINKHLEFIGIQI